MGVIFIIHSCKKVLKIILWFWSWCRHPRPKPMFLMSISSNLSSSILDLWLEWAKSWWTSVFSSSLKFFRACSMSTFLSEYWASEWYTMVFRPVSGMTGRTSGILDGIFSGLNGSASASAPEPSPSPLALLTGLPSSPRISCRWFMSLTHTDSLSSLTSVLWAIDILVLILAALALSFSIYSFSTLTLSMRSGRASRWSSVMSSVSTGSSWTSLISEVASLVMALYTT